MDQGAFDQRSEELDIDLVPGRKIVGRVVSGDGKKLPGVYVAGAALALVMSDTSSRRRQVDDWIEVETDGEGEFILHNVRRDVGYEIMLRKPGYGTRIYSCPRPVGESDTIAVGELTLTEGLSVSGRVTDARGGGIEQAQVFLLGYNRDRYSLVVGDRSSSVEDLASREFWTDSDGGFVFWDVPPGDYRLRYRVRQPGRFESRDVELEETLEDLELVVTGG